MPGADAGLRLSADFDRPLGDILPAIVAYSTLVSMISSGYSPLPVKPYNANKSNISACLIVSSLLGTPAL